MCVGLRKDNQGIEWPLDDPWMTLSKTWNSLIVLVRGAWEGLVMWNFGRPCNPSWAPLTKMKWTNFRVVGEQHHSCSFLASRMVAKYFVTTSEFCPFMQRWIVCWIIGELPLQVIVGLLREGRSETAIDKRGSNRGRFLQRLRSIARTHKMQTCFHRYLTPLFWWELLNCCARE